MDKNKIKNIVREVLGEIKVNKPNLDYRINNHPKNEDENGNPFIIDVRVKKGEKRGFPELEPGDKEYEDRYFFNFRTGSFIDSKEALDYLEKLK